VFHEDVEIDEDDTYMGDLKVFLPLSPHRAYKSVIVNFIAFIYGYLLINSQRLQLVCSGQQKHIIALGLEEKLAIAFLSNCTQ